MSGKKTGLGRGLSALIPNQSPVSSKQTDTYEKPNSRGNAAESELRETLTGHSRPADIFFGTDSSGTSDKVRDLLLPRKKVSRETSKTETSKNKSALTADKAKKNEKAKKNVSRETSSVELAPVPGAYLTELPTKSIVPNTKQPRNVFDEEEIQELADSIKEVGLLQPVVVRPHQDGYELIMGERRWRACQRAGLTHIAAIVRETEDEDLLRDALLENLHRVQLNPLEEAAAYQQLLNDFGCTQAQLATKIARSRPQIANTLRLLRLPSAVQVKLAAGVLSAGHARALLALTDSDKQIYLCDRIIAEGLSVRSTEEIVTLGNIHAKPGLSKNTSVKGSRPTDYPDFAATWEDRFESKVIIRQGKKSGKVMIEFADEEDLKRITNLLS